MALLAKKVIGPADVRRYILDYSDWLDVAETINSQTLAVVVDTVDGNPSSPAPVATVTNVSVSPDGQSVVFYVNGNDLANPPTTVGTFFAITIKITTVLAGSPPGQTLNHHVEFQVVAS